MDPEFAPASPHFLFGTRRTKVLARSCIRLHCGHPRSHRIHDGQDALSIAQTTSRQPPRSASICDGQKSKPLRNQDAPRASRDLLSVNSARERRLPCERGIERTGKVGGGAAHRRQRGSVSERSNSAPSFATAASNEEAPSTRFNSLPRGLGRLGRTPATAATRAFRKSPRRRFAQSLLHRRTVSTILGNRIVPMISVPKPLKRQHV